MKKNCIMLINNDMKRGTCMKIVLSHVTKKFKSLDKKNHSETIAVNDFDFEIPDGKLVGLLGPSGCGKSTTLNLISGLEPPTEGRIFFGDTDVTKLPPEKRGIGLVFQNYALYPHLTVLQNITFPLENLKGAERLSKEEMQKRAMDAARLVQLEAYLNRKPSQLSGGQQQRVAIARALVKQPNVLLLDEPLSNLDARLRLQTREEIRQLQVKTKVTTVFVTHDQDEAMSISDIIVVMKKGIIQQIGKPQDIYEDPVNLFVATFLGTPPISVFDAEIRNGGLYIGQECVRDAGNLPDGRITAAIRPEAFEPNPEGTLTLHPIRKETMGRDTSILAEHPSCTSGTIRTIVDSDIPADTSQENLRFKIRMNKLFLFSAETEERVYL